MKWEYLSTTLLFMVIGYLIGSISNAVIVSKFFKKEDVRTKGSGNAGATNIVRNYGKKLGGIVFFLDVMKVVIVMMAAQLTKEYSSYEPMSGILVPAVGLSVVVGHVYPIFFNFKGGKGAACTVGFVFSLNWPLVIVGVILFLLILKKTKTVALGSIFAPLLLLIIFSIMMYVPGYLDYTMLFGNKDKPWIDAIFFGIVWLIVVIKHIPNIKRIINKKENTF